MLSDILQICYAYPWRVLVLLLHINSTGSLLFVCVVPFVFVGFGILFTRLKLY